MELDLFECLHDLIRFLWLAVLEGIKGRDIIELGFLSQQTVF